MSTTTTTLNASCLCGTVKFTATGQDKNTVLCHCSNCKKASGSAFAHNHRLIKTQLDIRQGQASIREYRDSATKTGNTIGSSLYLRNPNVDDLVIVHCGIIDGECHRPKFFVFPEAKYDWVPDDLCTSASGSKPKM
ncbi:hypothetical protein MBLNU230_g6010t1 [Neophaeotheca triangularis]